MRDRLPRAAFLTLTLALPVLMTLAAPGGMGRDAVAPLLATEATLGVGILYADAQRRRFRPVPAPGFKLGRATQARPTPARVPLPRESQAASRGGARA